ncbi:MAG: hypothetical protein CSB01_00080 [Bacteroidia bacterium]|nr:MAG: hypothetical protein CSB01_00080 [Bacteroidia bacterium]
MKNSKKQKKERLDNEKVAMFFRNYETDFKPFFKERLQAKIEKINSEEYAENVFINNLSIAFAKVLYSGLAALVLILISIFITTGSLSIDSLLGLESISSEEITAYLLFDF